MNSHDFNAGFGLQNQVNELVQYKELVSRCYDDIAALKKAHREAVEFNNALAEENVTAHNRITALLARAEAAEVKVTDLEQQLDMEVAGGLSLRARIKELEAELSTLRESMRWIQKDNSFSDEYMEAAKLMPDFDKLPPRKRQ